MKHFIFILLLQPLLLLAQSLQEDTIQKRNTTKCKTICSAFKGKKEVVHGPEVMNPKTAKEKLGPEVKPTYNEQDNFKQKDSTLLQGVDSSMERMDLAPTENTPVYYKTTADPMVAFQFDADACTTGTPSDNTVAVSNQGMIVSGNNCGMAVYDVTGQLQASTSLSAFFNFNNNGFCDPRVLYDPYSDRFIAMAQSGNAGTNSYIHIAFSVSNNPLGNWYLYYFDMGAITNGRWFDFPEVAVNQTDLCVTGNIFSNSGNFTGSVVMLLNKQDGYSGVAFNNLHWGYWLDVLDNYSQPAFTMAPATAAMNTSYSNKLYLVSTLSSGGSYLNKFTISGNANNITSATMSCTTIPVQQYSPAGTAIQPNGPILANYKAGCRIQSAIYANGYVQFVYTGNYNSGSGNYNSIYFNRLNISNNSIQQNWSFLGGSNYAYPSLAAYGTSASDKTVLLCFLKSDASTYPEIRFKYFDDSMNQIASTQVRGGDSYVNYGGNEERWGDYSSIQRRYNASQSEAWLCGSFGNSSNRWHTHIAKVTGYPGIVTISEVNLEDELLRVYPNPVKDQLYVKGNLSNTKGFPELFDVTGKVMPIDATRQGDEMFQIDVTQLPAGTYILQIPGYRVIKFLKS